MGLSVKASPLGVAFIDVCARNFTCSKHSLAKSGTPVGRPVAFLAHTSIVES